MSEHSGHGTEASKRVLITAGFGSQARQIIPLLREARFRIRSMRATGGSGRGPIELGANEVVVGDASRPDDALRAMEGVDCVYHIGPTFHPLEREMGINMINQAKKAGVKHFIFSSVLHPILTGLMQHVHKREIEEHLLESGLNFTILQPADFMQASIGGYAPDLGAGKSTQRNRGDIYALGWDLDRRQSLVDLADVAEVVVKVVNEGARHFGATYELCSDDCLTAHQIAEAISRATGRPIVAKKITWTDNAYLKWFGNDDIASVQYSVDAFKALNAWYDKYDFVGNGNVLRMLLGRNPTSYEEFARRALASGT